jgi:hypothetical protein
MITNCEQCGATPAQLVKSRWHIGLVVYGRTMNKQAVLCRTHGRALVVSDLVKTVLLGWWGVYSFVINLLVIPAQIAELSKVGKREPAAVETKAAPSKATFVHSEVI